MKVSVLMWLWVLECYVCGLGVEGVDVECVCVMWECVDVGRAALSVASMMEYTTLYFCVMVWLMFRCVMLWMEMEVD